MKKTINTPLLVHFGNTSFSSLCVDFFTTKDLPRILEIENSASPYPWSKANFEQSLQTAHYCLGLKADGQWVAHAVLSSIAGEAEILILAVAKEQQRKGLAELFLQTVLNAFTEINERVFLEVRESNEKAIGLYEKLGFNCLGERPNYYPVQTKSGTSAREHALIYAKELNLTRV